MNPPAKRYAFPPSDLTSIHPRPTSVLQQKKGSIETIPNSKVGKELISQTISAMEHWRFQHAFQYKSVPEAQISLRSDYRIKTIESSAKHDEPKRIESSQILKATGSSAGECLRLSVDVC